VIYLNSKWNSLEQVGAEVLVAKTGMSLKVAIMESVIALEGAQIVLTGTPALETKSDPTEITTRRNLVTPTQGQIEVRNQNQRKPLNHHEEEETIVAIAPEAETTDSSAVSVMQ
jgi:hypothetical protein